MVVSNRNLLFQGSIFRGYVSFREDMPKTTVIFTKTPHPPHGWENKNMNNFLNLWGYVSCQTHDASMGLVYLPPCAIKVNKINVGKYTNPMDGICPKKSASHPPQVLVHVLLYVGLRFMLSRSGWRGLPQELQHLGAIENQIQKR